MRCLLVEREPEPFGRLEAFCDSVKDIEVMPRRWDFIKHVDDVLAYVGGSETTFPFFFIDPTGWDPIAIPVIRPILARRPAEVLVNLMTSWIVWLVGDKSKNLAEVLGGDTRDILPLSGDEREEAIVRRYCESFRRAGDFPYVCTLPVMKAEQDAMHYYLVYGTRHPKGVEVFKNTEKAVASFMHETRAETRAYGTRGVNGTLTQHCCAGLTYVGPTALWAGPFDFAQGRLDAPVSSAEGDACSRIESRTTVQSLPRGMIRRWCKARRAAIC
jgi:hypothetical protein